MKKTLLLFIAELLFLSYCQAQITITAADMPVKNDTLRYSSANPTALSILLTDTGGSKVWDYSTLVPITQTVDTYKNALAVNASYGITISPTAYGIKVADSIPGSPVSIQQIYNFYNIKTGPSRFVTEGFAAKLLSIPTPINYSDEDEIIFFPMTSTRPRDSSTFKLNYSFAGLGSFSQQGYRLTKVDAWGTIKTPYTSTPVSVLRVRSEIVEIDSVSFGTTILGIPRNTVEYKWLANGEHYPLLFVTTNKTGSTETISAVRYRDTKRNVPGLGVSNSATHFEKLSVYPNPVIGNELQIAVPNQWKDYAVRVFDMNGKLLIKNSNSSNVPVGNLANGNYFIIVESLNGHGVAQFVK